MPQVRKATITDIPQMHALLNEYARSQLMLPRSLGELYENMRDFVVADGESDKVIACGALHVVWKDLCEIKCLAVSKDHQKKGIGTALVKRLLAEGRRLKLKRVFCLTYRGPFFERFGFRPVSKDSLPHKVWSECIQCPQFPDCDEEAFLLEFT